MTKKTATHDDTFCLSLSSELKRSLKQRSALLDTPVCNIIEAGMTEYLRRRK